MSPRAVAPTSTRCDCGKPTRDAAVFCPMCLTDLVTDLHELVRTPSDRHVVQSPRHRDLPAPAPRPGAVALASYAAWCDWPRPAVPVPSLWDELDSAMVGERGIDYRTLGGATGPSLQSDPTDPGVAYLPTGLVLNESATRAAAQLIDTLLDLMRLAVRVVRPGGATTITAPARIERHHVEGMATWLAAHADALQWTPDARHAPTRVHDAITTAVRVVAPPARGHDLGPCIETPDCTGRLHAPEDQTFAKCNVCGSQIEARIVRELVIENDRELFLTAAEIVDRAMVLDLRVHGTREQVRKRVNAWASRGRIGGATSWAPGLCPWPLRAGTYYRFGDVYDLLVAPEARNFPLTHTTKESRR